MSDINGLIVSYGFNVESDRGQATPAVGLGDILFRLLMIQEHLDRSPFYVNTSAFKHCEWYPNPIEQLKMRLDLFKDILSHHKTLSTKDIIFVDGTHFNYHQNFRYDDLKRLKLDMLPSFWEKVPPHIEIPGEYIIFHTKLRLFSYCDYTTIKKQIADFCYSFKSKYKIVLLGEQNFPKTIEVGMHGITTIYDSLLKLNNLNEIFDNTEKDIYTNINYETYKRDIYLIKNAKYNICFGLGGHLCSSLVFGNTLFCPIVSLLKTTTFNIDGSTNFPSIDDMFNFLKTNLSD